MAKFKFKTKKKSKFNFIKNDEELSNYQIANESRTEIFSNKQIIIEGCQKILDYQDTYIKLKLKKGNISLLGEQFVIGNFFEEKIIIKGIISSIEFCI